MGHIGGVAKTDLGNGSPGNWFTPKCGMSKKRPINYQRLLPEPFLLWGRFHALTCPDIVNYHAKSHGLYILGVGLLGAHMRRSDKEV
jgi:hypothetical protein